MHYHLVTYPHKTLRQVSQPISDFNAILAENIEQMFELLNQTWAPPSVRHSSASPHSYLSWMFL